MSEPDPFEASSTERARTARAAGEETGAPKERLATLWVRPGQEETPTTDPYPMAPATSRRAPDARPRGANRTALAVVLLLGSAAIALAAAVVVPRWLDVRREIVTVPPAAPVQEPAPPPIATAASTEPTSSPNAGKMREAPAKRAHKPPAGPALARRGALINPAPVDRRCVPRALRSRSDLAGRLPAEIAVRFRVTASGDVARIEVPDLPDRDLANAVAEAVRSCRFSAGTDEEGRPVALPIVMRIRFAAPPEATSGF